MTSELSQRADRDPLTGALNRRAFDEQLERELQRSRRTGDPLTLVAIDLDGFKQVNDSLGHATGDAVLRQVVSLFEHHARAHDLVGRIGGDEIAVALTGSDDGAARDLIRRVRIHLVPVRRKLGLPREFGLSWGAATTRGSDELASITELHAQADEEMYRMKRPGGRTTMDLVGRRRGATTDDPSSDSDEQPQARVLVVDDDPLVRDLCRTALEAEGVQIVEASSGVEALQRDDLASFDAIVMDVVMPGPDGWSVARDIEARLGSARPAIVMITGTALEAATGSAAGGVADSWIGKPFTGAEVVDATLDALELAPRLQSTHA